MLGVDERHFHEDPHPDLIELVRLDTPQLLAWNMEQLTLRVGHHVRNRCTSVERKRKEVETVKQNR